MIRCCAALLLCGCSPAAVEQQHAIAMQRHLYVTDQTQYGKEEVWTPSLVGDCEDYALWMRERVGGNIILVRTKDGVAHVVLDVSGKIVDNLSRTVYQRQKMTHKVIKELNDTQVNQMLKGYPIP